MTAYEVGQRVWFYGINDRGRPPTEGTVTKVGRTLVTVAIGHGQSQQFRIETGQINSRDYPHHYWVKTEQQRAADQHKSELNQRLESAGIAFRLGARLPIEVIEDIVAVLDKHGIGGAA